MEAGEVPVQVTTNEVRVDGQTVITRLFRGPAPRSLVLVAGAFAVRQRFYSRYAEDLASRGHAVLTVDYRGLGESRPARLRGCGASALDWLRDLEAAVATARRELPDLPLSVVAHSFGGQVLPLSAFADQITRTITIGTQFVRPEVWRGAARLRMAATFGLLIPVVSRVYGYLPGWTGIGEDTPGVAAREWARWCRSPRYLLDHVPGAEAAYAAFRSPVTAVAITDDDYAPLAGVRTYAAALPDATVEIVAPADVGLDELGHFGPFRPSARALWDRMADALEPAEASLRAQ